VFDSEMVHITRAVKRTKTYKNTEAQAQRITV